MQQYIPLIETEAESQGNTQDSSSSSSSSSPSNLIKTLWEEQLCKQPEDPYEVLSNHRLITNNNIVKIEDEKNRFTVNANIHSKLYVTLTKKFADITYKDALPFKNYFITKETSITDIQNKHNNIVDKITYLRVENFQY